MVSSYILYILLKEAAKLRWHKKENEERDGGANWFQCCPIC